MERTRSIFGVEEEVPADALIGGKVRKSLECATPVVRVDTKGEEIVERASRRRTRNSAAPS